MLPTEFFSPSEHRCHGNKIWDKIGYNSAYVRDICKIFASIRGFSGIGHRIMLREFFPEKPSLPWQQNLGHNGLELSLRKRYVEDLCIRWGVFKIGLLWYGQCAIIQKRTYAPPQKSYVKYKKNRYYQGTKTFLHFLSLL